MPYRWLAASFGVLGAATLAANGAAALLSRPGSPVLVMLSSLYGLAALLTAYGLWHRSRLGPRAFLGWCATIALFLVAILLEEPGYKDILLTLPALALAGVLYLGWRYISRVCVRAA